MTDYDPKYDIPEATQVKYPWRAAIRTTIAVLVGLGITTPLIWAIILEETAKAGVVIPASVGNVVSAGLAILAVVVGVVTRVMAIPSVNDVLTKTLDLGAKPR